MASGTVGRQIFYASAWSRHSINEDSNLTETVSGCIDFMSNNFVPFGSFYNVDACTRCQCVADRIQQLCHQLCTIPGIALCQIRCAPPEHCPSGAFKRDPKACCDICVTPVVIEGRRPEENMTLRLGVVAITLFLVVVLFVFALHRIKKGGGKLWTLGLRRLQNLRRPEPDSAMTWSEMADIGGPDGPYATYRAATLRNGSVVLHGLQPPPPYSAVMAQPTDALTDSSAANTGSLPSPSLVPPPIVIDPGSQTLPPPYASNGTVISRSLSRTAQISSIGGGATEDTLSVITSASSDGTDDDDDSSVAYSGSGDDQDDGTSDCTCSLCCGHSDQDDINEEEDGVSESGSPHLAASTHSCSRPSASGTTATAGHHHHLPVDLLARLCHECHDIVQHRLTTRSRGASRTNRRVQRNSGIAHAGTTSTASAGAASVSSVSGDGGCSSRSHDSLSVSIETAAVDSPELGADPPSVELRPSSRTIRCKRKLKKFIASAHKKCKRGASTRTERHTCQNTSGRTGCVHTRRPFAPADQIIPSRSVSIDPPAPTVPQVVAMAGRDSPFLATAV